MLVIVVMLSYGSVRVIGQTEIPTARDVSVKRQVPTPKETIPTEQLMTLVSREASGTYSKDRVITPPMALAVRQEHPEGQRYQ